MTIAIRVDSSREVGHGHLARCLTLGDALRARGEEVVLLCRDLPGAQLEAVRSEGFRLLTLSVPDGAVETQAPAHASWLRTTRATDASETLDMLANARITPDWVVADSYALDARWEEVVRAGSGCRIAVIDDMGDRQHDCDVLVDTGCRPDMPSEYVGLVPGGCSLLLGPRHAFLRKEFARARAAATARSELRNVLIFFGGSDHSDATATALEGVAPAAAAGAVEVTVVLGAGYSRAAGLREQFGRVPGVTILGPTRRIAELMASADLALGAGGTSTWERCFLGLPSGLVALAENQKPLAETVAAAGAARYLGPASTVRPADWRALVDELGADPGSLSAMSRSAFGVVEGAGPTRHHELVSLLLSWRSAPPQHAMRPLVESDLETVLEWRNAPAVSDRMTNRHPIGEGEHRAWFGRVKDSNSVVAKVFESNGVRTGFLQLRRIDRASRSAEWGFYLAPEAMGRGLGTVLCFLGAEAAFDDEGLDVVYAEVREGSDASRSIHDRLGFVTTTAIRPNEAGAAVLELTRNAWDGIRTRVAERAYAGRLRT